MNAHHRVLLAAGVCFLVAGLLLGCASGFHLPSWLGGAETPDAPPCKPHDETGLVGIFGWLAWVCVVCGVLSLIASVVFPVVPTRASATAIVVGVGCGFARGLIVKYSWLVYAGLGVCVVALAWPCFIAARRWIVAKTTGKPIEGHTGLEAVKQLNPFHKPKRKGPFDGLDPNRGVRGVPADRLVRAAQAGPEPDKP